MMWTHVISAQCSEQKDGDMVSFVVLLGDKLAGKDGEVTTEIALTRRMRKPLSNTWRNAIFGSALHRRNKDRMLGECEEFKPPRHTTEVDDKFKVSGFPPIVFLDSEGALTTTDGRAAISADQRAEICLGSQNFSAKSLPMQVCLAPMVHTKEATISLAGWLACISVRTGVLRVAVSHLSWPITTLQI